MKSYEVVYGCVKANGKIDGYERKINLDLEYPSESVAYSKLKPRKELWQTSSEQVDVVIFRVIH